MTQLTTKRTCKMKHTYHSSKTANAARKRRNNNSLKSFYFTAAYQCNICQLWHLTTQNQEMQVAQDKLNNQQGDVK